MTLPPGPKMLPPMQLLRWIAAPTQFLEACAHAYGDRFTVNWSGFAPFIMLSDPLAIQEIFAADSKVMEGGRANGILRPLLGDMSLILLDGDRHQRQRRLLTPPFHGDRMKAYGQLICDITDQVMSECAIGQPFSVRTTMQEISLRVILHAVFGVSEGDRYQQLKHLLAEMLDTLGSPLRAALMFLPFLQKDWGAWSPWGQFLRRRQQLDDLIYQEIRDRRAHLDPNREDILTLLLLARDEAGEPMTDLELRDELITLLVAGHETTASALTWALYWIHSLPEVASKLTKELTETNLTPDLAAVSKLPYLNAVCQETLRLYPIAMLAFPRIPKQPFTLLGQEFPAGTVLVPCIYLVHHREDLYPQSYQFRPERFLERSFSPSEFLPFGGGARRCIGLAFANFEMKLVLMRILTRYRLELLDDRPVKPQRRGVTLAPPNRFRMVITETDREAQSAAHRNPAKTSRT